mmetsp:Transcript_19516/g.49952  ORF Transcript_19516/g.49952 Transcript_19516/m.49952 type:complete len:227 (-) Transcript_19516:427-1107(-)
MESPHGLHGVAHRHLTRIGRVPALLVLVVARGNRHHAVPKASKGSRQAIHGLAEAASLRPWRHLRCHEDDLVLLADRRRQLPSRVLHHDRVRAPGSRAAHGHSRRALLRHRRWRRRARGSRRWLLRRRQAHRLQSLLTQGSERVREANRRHTGRHRHRGWRHGRSAGNRCTRHNLRGLTRHGLRLRLGNRGRRSRKASRLRRVATRRRASQLRHGSPARLGRRHRR